MEQPAGLTIGTIPNRADPRDVLISRTGQDLDSLADDAIVGTSSLRRTAQLLASRPGLRVAPLRGNVDTRVRKLDQGQYDAIVLAGAGIQRLGLEKRVSQWLPLSLMLPAPGQGALAVQCREEDLETQRILAALEHPPTRAATSAERAFLAALGGGCALPVGALGSFADGSLELQGMVASPDGQRVIRVCQSGDDPITVGNLLAELALHQGALEVLHA